MSALSSRRRRLRIAQVAIPVLAALSWIASRVAPFAFAEQVRIVNTGLENPESRSAEVWVLDSDVGVEKAVRETDFRRSGRRWVSSLQGQQLVLGGYPRSVVLLRHSWSGIARIEAGLRSWDVDLYAPEPGSAVVPLQPSITPILSTWLPLALFGLLLLLSSGDLLRVTETVRVRLVRRGGLAGLRPIREARHFLEDRKVSGLVLVALVASVAYLGAAVSRADRSVSFVMIGHAYPLLHTGMLERAARDLASNDLDLLFLAGDLVLGDDYDRDYRYVRDLFGGSGLVAVPGNHDVDSGEWNGGEPRDRLAERFESWFGPRHGVRTLGDCLFVWLDTCATEYPDPYGLDEEQIDFLRETLEDHSGYRHKFVVMHHMLWRFSDASDNPRFRDWGWRERVAPLLKEHGVRYVLAGDSSVPLHEEIDGIHHLAVGFPKSEDGRECFYLKVDVAGATVAFDWVLLPPEDLPPLPVYDVELRPDTLKSFRSISRDDSFRVRFRCGEFESPGTIRLRGDTAANWANRKKSYLISLERPYGGRERLKLFIPADRRYQMEDLNAWRAAKLGLAAPRVELVRLQVNGVDHGVYQDIEDLDSVFLERNSITGDSNLYTCIDYHGNVAFNGGWNPIFENVNFWDKKTRDFGRPDECSDLALLLDAIRGSEAAVAIDRVLDIDNFHAWRVHSLIAGSGHQSLIANMRFYFDPTRGRFFLVPWDVGMDPAVRFLQGRRGRQFITGRSVDEVQYSGPAGIPLESNNNPLVAAVLRDPQRQVELHRRLWRYVSDPQNRQADLDRWDELHAKCRVYHLLDKWKTASNVELLREFAFERFILQQNLELLEAMLAGNAHSIAVERQEDHYVVRVTVGNVSGFRLESEDPSLSFGSGPLLPHIDRSEPFDSHVQVQVEPRTYEVRVRSAAPRDEFVRRMRSGAFFRLYNLVTDQPVILAEVH